MRGVALAWMSLLGLLLLPVAAGVITGGSLGLSYVTSNSMEPLLRVGDGFVVIPDTNPGTGDIIVYRPLVLQAERVIHRVTGVSPRGYLTRGDNTPASDQAAGEPPVAGERIIGQALNWEGNPVRIPGVKAASELVKDLLGRHMRTALAVLAAMSGLLFLADYLRPGRQRSPRRRWRVGHLYGAVSAGFVLVVLLTMTLGSRVQSVDYLVSESPNPEANHVTVGKPGVVRTKVANLGLLPVFHFSRAIAPDRVAAAPNALAPRSGGDVAVATPANPRPGWYRAYVRVYHYPPLLPRVAIAWLHDQSPFLAAAGVALILALGLALLSRTMDLWVPLAAQREGPTMARIRRTWRAAVGGRRSG